MDQETVIYMYIMEFYLAIWKNYAMWFEGKWMALEDSRVSEVSLA
jgi:hypothetical protein